MHKNANYLEVCSQKVFKGVYLHGYMPEETFCTGQLQCQ